MVLPWYTAPRFYHRYTMVLFCKGGESRICLSEPGIHFIIDHNIFRCCQDRPVARLFCEGGQIGQILGPFMITRGLSCDRVEFGHFGGGQMTPPTPPWLRACKISKFIHSFQTLTIDGDAWFNISLPWSWLVHLCCLFKCWSSGQS